MTSAMGRRNLIGSFSVLSLVLISNFALAVPYNSKLYNSKPIASDSDFSLPWENSFSIKLVKRLNDCEFEASQLRQNFIRITGIKNVTTHCFNSLNLKDPNDHQKSFVLFPIELTYTYNPEDKLKSIYTQYLGHTLYESPSHNLVGYYTTFQQCLNEMPMRSNEFTHNTGLLPLATTCEMAISDYPAQSYVLRIDSYGAPEVTLQAASDFSDKINAPSLKGAVEKIILYHQGKIVGRQNGYLYFYAKDRILPREMHFGVMSSEECNRQVNEGYQILSGSEPKEVTVGCNTLVLGDKTWFELIGIFDNFYSLEQYNFPENYYSFEDCRNDIPRALHEARKSGFEVNHGICRIENYYSLESTPQYQVDLYK